MKLSYHIFFRQPLNSKVLSFGAFCDEPFSLLKIVKAWKSSLLNINLKVPLLNSNNNKKHQQVLAKTWRHPGVQMRCSLHLFPGQVHLQCARKLHLGTSGRHHVLHCFLQNRPKMNASWTNQIAVLWLLALDYGRVDRLTEAEFLMYDSFRAGYKKLPILKAPLITLRGGPI